MTAPQKPTIIVVLGATGDLMGRKIVPALYHLFNENNLPSLFRIIGFARRPLTDEDFKSHVRTLLKEHDETDINEKTDTFLRHFSYQQGQFAEMKDYIALGKRLGLIDKKWKTCANKLFYLAVPPQDYEGILRNLSESGLTAPCSPEEGWTRVLVEKPFGKDLVTSMKLDELLGSLFKEEQIYRIDHYLAKEMLQNIISFRFANNWFEDGWNGKDVERIDIRLWESIGVEKRGLFYDGVGALRDVGQNHLLQMLALVTMDHPMGFDAASIRKKRAELLQYVRPPRMEDMKISTYRAQYEGYRTIKGVQPQSKTETFFKVRLTLENERWKHVPVIIESGKRMPHAQKEIVITFRHTTPCLCPPNGKHLRNQITFSMEPNESIIIDFASKRPGLQFAVEERSFSFSLRAKAKGRQYVEEYEKLLLDAIRGDQTLFVSTDEVRQMWNVIDPIAVAWAKNEAPLHAYKPDTKQAIDASSHIGKPTKKQSIGRTIGMVGLGKMGANLSRQLMRKGWKVYGYNRTEEVTRKLMLEGLQGTFSLKEFVASLPKPRVIWVMLPAGDATNTVLFGKKGLISYLKKGDIVIDGSNSFYKDTITRYKKASRKKIEYIDVGVSGGPKGALEGASLMIGGDTELFTRLKSLFYDVAVYDGVSFFSGKGAGHFVKMVHNGIEYGMMQAMAEGFTLLKKSDFRLDLTRVAEIYNHGSVIESKLMGWLQNALIIHNEDFIEVSGSVAQTGEGKWTVETARKMRVPIPVIEKSVQFRTTSQKKPSYTGKILSAIRAQFGGHKLK